MKKQTYMKLGFPEMIDVSGRVSIADLYRSSKKRTGIYLLQFPDGDYYVGQSVDVVRRFSEHVKGKGPISGFSFFAVPEYELDQQEHRCITLLEQKCNLKNISLVTLPEVETDFDAVLSREEQQDWLVNDRATPKYPSLWQNSSFYEQMRKKYSDRFTKLLSDPYFEKYVLPVMQKYIKYCIPEPLLSEISFWNCSCLPPYNSNSIIYSRINLRSCEVFTVSYHRPTNDFCYSFHTSLSPFENISDQEFNKFNKQFPSFELGDYIYPSAGSDQCNPTFTGFTEVMNALDHPLLLKAIKTFNLGQMRKGAPLYRSSHCVDLAELLMSGMCPTYKKINENRTQP